MVLSRVGVASVAARSDIEEEAEEELNEQDRAAESAHDRAFAWSVAVSSSKS
jgi:hypothetical protein